jgi:hypothetical protein
MISQIKRGSRQAWAAHPLLYSAVMNKLLALGLSLPLVACVIGSGSEPGDPGTGSSGGSGGSDLGSGPGPGGDHITADKTWTDTVSVTGTTTVDAGVTLTIAAGTTVKFGPTGALVVKGILNMTGTKAQNVTLVPATTGDHFIGTTVSAGGSITMSYVTQTGGGITVDGGTLTVTDSRMSHASHDFLVVGDGKVDVSYSSIGMDPDGGSDSTHCGAHFGSSGATIKVTYSNISTSTFGLMLYGGNNVDLTFNNWSNNATQIDTLPGVSANLSGGWFDKGAPTAVGSGGATLTYNNPAPNRLPATMVGPR